jgi:hypothetical protein
MKKKRMKVGLFIDNYHHIHQYMDTLQQHQHILLNI